VICSCEDAVKVKIERETKRKKQVSNLGEEDGENGRRRGMEAIVVGGRPGVRLLGSRPSICFFLGVGIGVTGAPDLDPPWLVRALPCRC
jgi:hypothetical protein